VVKLLLSALVIAAGCWCASQYRLSRQHLAPPLGRAPLPLVETAITFDGAVEWSIGPAKQYTMPIVCAENSSYCYHLIAEIELQ
jgi:hypothetical protein